VGWPDEELEEQRNAVPGAALVDCGWVRHVNVEPLARIRFPVNVVTAEVTDLISGVLTGLTTPSQCASRQLTR